MAENKTKKTDVSPQSYMDGIADEARRADCQAILDMMGEISGSGLGSHTQSGLWRDGIACV